jgi:hypothetical protein
MWFTLALGNAHLGPGPVILLLLVMGGTAGGFASTLWAIVRETTNPRILGVTSGLLNPAPFFGVAVLQVATGAVLDRIGRVDGVYPPAAYKDAFLLCALIMAFCLVLVCCFRKTLGKAP